MINFYQKQKMHLLENKSLLGYAIIISTLLITLVLWLTTLSDYAFMWKDPFLFLSKIAVLIGTIGICWTFMLSTRLGIFETAFNGLDKVYHVHKNMGKFSFYCITLHVFFQFMRHVPDWSRAFGLFVPLELDGTAYGLIAFILFCILIALTFIPIPYHIWKRSHEFFIFVLIFSFLHVFFINKHVNASFALSIWLYGFLCVGFISYIYIRFLYRFLGPRYSYVISKIEALRTEVDPKKPRQTWNVYLEPTAQPMPYKPGQFVYVVFYNKHLSKEPHPYSISSYPSQPYIRLSIKSLGDHTSKLGSLQKNDPALLWGPYGRFYEKYLYEDKDAVMIAGGIGITPFLSMLGHEAHHPRERTTHIFYCVKKASKADFDLEIEKYAQKNPHIIAYTHCTMHDGFINVHMIRDHIENFKSKNFFICGPKPMMDAMIKQLRHAGVANYSIVYEDFNFLQG